MESSPSRTGKEAKARGARGGKRTGGDQGQERGDRCHEGRSSSVKKEKVAREKAKAIVQGAFAQNEMRSRPNECFPSC